MKTLISYFTKFAWAALVFAILPVVAQEGSTTYTVDPSFDSGNLFRDLSGINSIVVYNDGRILVGGRFDPLDMWSPFYGLGMVWGDGTEFTQWGGAKSSAVVQVALYPDGFLATAIGGLARCIENGTTFNSLYGQRWIEYQWTSGIDNPYNIESMWCVYVQEDDKVLIGGAIATDTTRPYLYRSLMRVLPDGSHDTTFPAIEIEPNNQYSRILTIDKDSQGKWLVSGNFYAINGHETAFIARLSPDFSVDTTFVSGLKYVFSVPEPNIVLLDSQDRMWLSGHYVVAQNNPQDTLNLMRLLPSGEVDTTFMPKGIEKEYPPGTIDYGSPLALLSGGLELDVPNRYMIYGAFNYWNDTLQHCITVVDDAGYIQQNYFMGSGASERSWNGLEFQPPSIEAVEELPDGSLIIGGEFSKFMGATHYNLIKLNRGTIGTIDYRLNPLLSVYPNPGSEWIQVTLTGTDRADVEVYDLSGRTVYRGQMPDGRTRITTNDFSPGIYFVHVRSGKGVAVKKFTVE